MDIPGDRRHRVERRARILERISSLRQARTASDEPATVAPADALSALAERVDRLEAAFEGLQDSVYRDSQRHEQELSELRREIQPARMAQSLSRDARERGL